MSSESAEKDKPAKKEKPTVTPARVKRIIGVLKVVLPFLVPLVLQGAAVVRDRVDRARARRLGVPVERLGEFTGKGAALHARISGLATSANELRATHPDEGPFIDAAERRLADLAGAVRAAEQMPWPRRRATHEVVRAELDTLDADLLKRFGVGA